MEEPPAAEVPCLPTEGQSQDNREVKVGTRKKPLHSSDSDQFRAIGQAIRNTRHGRYTVESLAERAGISIGQLSQIENGRGNPTVEMLIRIGAAFNVDAVDFIERRPPSPTHVIRRSERRKHVLDDDREITLLTPGLRYEFTVTYMELGPGESRTTRQFDGHNVFYVLSGEVSVEVRGTTHVLKEQDALVCQTAERITNTGDQPSVFIVCFRPEGD